MYELDKYKFKKTGSTARIPGSGRPLTATTQENCDATEELIMSQEDKPGSHSSLRQIEPELGISHTSVLNICRKRKVKSFTRERTPQMSDATKTRRIERAGELCARFSEKDLPRLAFQDESQFTLQVQTNRKNNVVWGKGRKDDILAIRLNQPANKFSDLCCRMLKDKCGIFPGAFA